MLLRERNNLATAFDALRELYRTLLPEMTDDDFAWFEARGRVRTVPKGGTLFRAGEVCSHVSFITKGVFYLCLEQTEREIVTAFMREGDYISEYASFLTRSAGYSTLVALEECTVIEHHYDDVQEAYRRFPAFQKFGRLLAERLFIMLDEGIRDRSVNTVETRYVRIVANSPDLLQRVPQYLIASYLGVTPETLSRIRKRIAESAMQTNRASDTTTRTRTGNMSLEGHSSANEG